MNSERLSIPVEGGSTVTGLWLTTRHPRSCLVLAHGAGAGMEHASMSKLAEGLRERGVATLRYNFPYMERGSKRVDPAPVAHAAVRGAVREAKRLAGDMPLFAGGRSFGGRMTSQAQAIEPLPDVRGLLFFAFPLHPAGKPSTARADHLAQIRVPMLFLQGTRDALAQLDLLRGTVDRLGGKASLALAEEADHSFHVPAKTGRRDADVLAGLLDTAVAWMAST